MVYFSFHVEGFVCNSSAQPQFEHLVTFSRGNPSGAHAEDFPLRASGEELCDFRSANGEVEEEKHFLM